MRGGVTLCLGSECDKAYKDGKFLRMVIFLACELKGSMGASNVKILVLKCAF